MPARNTFAATRRSHAILKRLRRGEGVTIREVSDEFGIQYPQARADLKLLEELYELNTYRRGRTKVWEMPDVNSNEAVVGIAAALELGGVALDIFKDTPYGEYIDKVADEYRRRVGSPYNQHLQRLSSALVLRQTWLPTEPEKMIAALEQILDCIALRRGVRIKYERADGEQGNYLLIPRRLIWYQGRLWLQGIHEGIQKLFDVAGVQKATYVQREALIDIFFKERLKAELTLEDAAEEGDEVNEEERRQALRAEIAKEVGELFEYGSREEEDAYFGDAFGIFASNFEPQTVKILVKGTWANYLRRYRLHPSQQNKEVEQGLQVAFRIGICPEFRSFLQSMIPNVEILAPQELRESLQEEIARWES